jgi:predicted ATPase/transcriptional regulator with XRE-family HTH domain/tetratricopeptide (TPR) repeat protein
MDYSTSTTFGDRLRRHRLAAGLTQEALAERTGLGVRSIQHLEGGGHLPQRDTLGRLIEGLGLIGGERSELERLAKPAPRARETASGPRVQPSDHAPRHNLPAQLTSFVGRERELVEVRRLLGATRLLTVTGAGGCGKTRLALRVATDLLASYADGIWFVDLAPLSDPALVTRTVASAAGVPEKSGQPILESLLYVMRVQKVLLLLDNCEHLIDTCAGLAETILKGCPRVQILATSREGLGIAGEVSWSVPTLPVPPDDRQTSHPAGGVAALGEFAAIRLFVERARTADPAFDLTDRNAAVVAQICRRLDGIPLAIELAAARVKVFSAERIAARLDDRFRLLTGGSRTALPRQRTLRATIDWSYDLLSEPERALFRRLAVFAGGCTLEAIEGVCAGEGIGEPDVADLLTRLVERSLVVVERGERERYWSLETLRQYGRERLAEAGEDATLRDRHRDWFLRFAERAKPELIGPDQVRWFDVLEAEHDNLRAALAWTVERGPAILGLRLVGAVWRLWHVRDYLVEARDWLTRVLALPGAEEPTLARAEVLIAASEIRFNLGERSGLFPLAEEARAIYQTLGNRRGVARAMFCLAGADEERAEEMLGQALVVAHEADSAWDVGQIIQHLAKSAQLGGEYPLARHRMAEAVAIFRRVGDHRALAVSLVGLGKIACQAGDLTAAHTSLEEALTVSRVLRSDRRTSEILDTLGVLAWLEGDHERSQALLEEALALARRVAPPGEIGRVLFHLGALARAEADTAEADTLVKESLWLLGGYQSLADWADLIHSRGILAIERGAYRPGVRLLGAADRLTDQRPPQGADDCRADEEALATARAALGEGDFAAAWAEGQAMALEQAVTDALQEGGG